jgi:hypothetical protein
VTHIRYGDRNYKIAKADFEGVKAEILNALGSDNPMALSIKEVIDGDAYPSTLFISRGVHISAHEWDTTQL